MQVYVIDESGNEVAVPGSVPKPRPGYKAVPVGAKNGTTVFRYVPEGGSEFGPPGYSPDMSAPARSAADSVFGGRVSPQVSVGGKSPKVSKGSLPSQPAGEDPQNRVAGKMRKLREVPTGITAVSGAEAPRPQVGTGSGLSRYQEELSTQAPDLGPTGLPPDPLAKFGKEEIPPEPPILKTAEAKVGGLPEDPLARMRDEATAENEKLPGSQTPPDVGGSGKKGRIDWTGAYGTSEETQMPVITDKESLGRYKDIGQMGEAEQRRQYDRYLSEIDKAGEVSPEQERLKGERGAALERYQQGLDRSERSKFIDALANNLGKFAAGYAGMKTGTPVGKYYEYTSMGMPEMQRETAEKKYGAEMANIAAQEKDIKEKQGLKLEARAKAVDFAMTLPAAQQSALYKILQLQNGLKRMGVKDETNFITPENLQQTIDKWGMDKALRQMELQHDYLVKKMDIASREKEGQLGREATRENELIKEEGAYKRAVIAAAAGVGKGGAGGPTTTIEEDTDAKKAFRTSAAAGHALSTPIFRTESYQRYRASNDLEGAKRDYLAQLEGQMRKARSRGNVAEFNEFVTNVSTAMPYIKSFDELEAIGPTLNKLGQDQNGVFGPLLWKGKTVEKGLHPQEPTAAATPQPMMGSGPSGQKISREDAINTLQAALNNPNISPQMRADIEKKIAELKGMR